MCAYVQYFVLVHLCVCVCVAVKVGVSARLVTKGLGVRSSC